jgi:nitrite reductase/ring-hydroxylating ferredoxin subunit/DMSO/TMAO reductase YedYZ heme-binding membrane subunit
MGHAYKVVQWTPYKVRFDLTLAIGVAAFLAAFVLAALMAQPPGEQTSAPQLVLRALGASAFSLLTIILAIGPAARLSRRFLPLLYNRRHLAVTCFLLALAHASLVLVWYHGLSHANPIVSLFTSNPRYDSIGGFPFESLGAAALTVLFVMAATSHDFWNALLGPSWWKAMHMAIYPAYALVAAHIMLGAVQAERGFVYAGAVGLAAAGVAALHVIAGARERAKDRAIARARDDGWLHAGAADDIPDSRARIIRPDMGEAIAVFRDGQRIYAISNRCRHQGGPLGEGRIVDGCITCPRHGFQYRPADGCSPPPYTERVATYKTRIERGEVFVSPSPESLGAETAPSMIGPVQ